MKCESVYLARNVSRPGRDHATSTAHFPAKAGFDIDLNEQTGWVTVSKDGQSRMIPAANVLWVVPAKPAVAVAAKPPVKSKAQPGVDS